MQFDEWIALVPPHITRDVLWRLVAYRRAMHVSSEGWPDAVVLARHPLGRSIADQLVRSLGSIGANVAEGYSRGTGADRARFVEYALGSAREARHWYYEARHLLGEGRSAEQGERLSEIIRLLIAILPLLRRGDIRQR